MRRQNLPNRHDGIKATLFEMRNFFSLLLSSFILLTAFAFAAETTAWELMGQGPDFKLYKKPSAGSSDLVAFRVVGTLQATPLEAATAILDREHRMGWMRDVKTLRTVSVPARGSVIEYTEVKTPFIIKNRDFVIRTDVEVDLSKERISITSKSIIDASVPETSDVRGELTDGRFLIEKGPEVGTSILTADMDVDPKGAVPNWIVNKFQKKWPIGMFRGLTYFLKQKVAKLPEDLRPLFEPAPKTK